MSHRYAPLPNPRTDPAAQSEMEAAFDSPEDDDDHFLSESQPLNPSPPTPGSYDFENVDYDYPPPGSPPAPSSVAVPNNYGNSNGIIPSLSLDTASPGPRRGWFKRSATALLPSHYIQRLGWGSSRPTGVIGAGTNNDGVFANVTAKPSRPVRITEGDDTYMVPEDTRAEPPPSYAHAQADAVPAYWETTVHAPFSSDALGEMIVDSLPTGTLFAFLWNMLVSISFQFVGFLLTYLLHTTHAARLGSRAGLGVTLIQYGFALRKADSPQASDSNDNWTTWKKSEPFETAPEADAYYQNVGNGTMSVDPEQAVAFMRSATTEWLSFFLMTVGWFILLTSLLGFWRVKRWERGIIASQRENAPPPTGGDRTANGAFVSHLDALFGLRGSSRGELLRQGLGFGSSHPHAVERERLYDERDAPDIGERELMIPLHQADPQTIEAMRSDRQLQRDLRLAGLL